MAEFNMTTKSLNLHKSKCYVSPSNVHTERCLGSHVPVAPVIGLRDCR